MQPKSVLIVEDDPDGQELVARMLIRASIPVEVAGTAEDALQLLSSDEHVAVVIDLALPGMDGFELLSRIREDTALASLPCIAITAYHTPSLKQRVMNDGFNAYFPKPLDDIRFLRTIREIVGTTG
ncbi:MAG: response regulator [Chloroflexi bacterium]|nr:response regulator [Chloroflexota bacterium]